MSLKKLFAGLLIAGVGAVGLWAAGAAGLWSDGTTDLDAVGDAQVDFSSHWHDGRAELDGYRLTVDRYGEQRAGTCVMIYVTEPFSESKRVKPDDAAANPDDTFDAIKLNLVRNFQTGIYDYNTMVSVFSRTSDFSPAKISFSSAEWCGHVFENLLFYPDSVTGYYHSYFEGESGPVRLANSAGGIAEDNLFILLRGLKGDFLEPGDKRKVRFLPSVYAGRLMHAPPGWTNAVIGRKKATQTINVPAGEFTVMVYTVAISEGRKGTFYVEEAYPHRIVRWEMPPDVKGELTGSERLAYWNLNKNGDEKHLRSLGLE